MTITENMYTVLAGISAITALVPATRILPPGPWQNVARPYIVHFPVSLVPTITHSGQQELRIWDFYQISVFADTFAQGDAVADAIIRNLPGNHSGVEIFCRDGSTYYQGGRPVDERMTVQVQHFVLDFRIAEAL
jgi:hypothetical protein